MNAELSNLVDRLVALEEQRADIGKDISDAKAEAKSRGYDPTLVMKCVKLRMKDAEKRRKELDQIELFDTYLVGCGLIASDEREATPPHDPDTGVIIETRAAADDAPGSTAESREGDASGDAEPEATDRAATGGDLADLSAPTETAAATSPPITRQIAVFDGAGRPIGGEASRAGRKPYPLDERGLEHAGDIPEFLRRA